MKIFDFNIHLPSVSHADVNVVIENDMNLDVAGIKNGFQLHRSALQRVDSANVLLFNPRLFDSPLDLRPLCEKAVYTAIVDPRRRDVAAYLDRVTAAGACAVIFNSYLQRIADAEFPLVYEVCRLARERDLIICIDGSYGTSRMFDYDNIKLCCYIADRISDVPIVIIHSGGRRILEAMLLAQDKRNVWLDTSFSLPFYIGSSLEADYAFAYKKLGCERVVYGSDHPYVASHESLSIHLKFFERHGFSDAEVRAILYENAASLVSVK